MPDDFRAAGYDLRADGEGERILAGAIRQQFVLSSSGALEPMIEGSTRPVASMVSHDAVCKVERYSFELADQDRLQRTIR